MNELIKKSADVAETALHSRRARVSWLVLLALATLQFAIAQHSSAHEIEDLAESCQFCIQLDDNVPSLDEALPAAPVPVASVDFKPATTRLAARRYPRAGATRAPPGS